VRPSATYSPGDVVFLPTQRLVLAVPGPCLELIRLSERAREFFSGGIAEAVSRVVLHPVETMKVRKQMSASLDGGRSLKNMYRGIGESVAGAVPTTAAFAMMYNMLKNKAMEYFPEKWEGAVSVASATLATTIASCIEEPLELIKQRLQSGVSHNFVDAFRDATKTKGLKGLYSGLRSSLARDLPFDALEFATYEQLRKLYVKIFRKDDVRESEMLFLGMATGALVGTVTLPMDVVRTRIVTQPLKYQSVRKTVRLLATEEGIMSLFRGWKHRVFKEAIDSGLFFVVYENVQKCLTNYATKTGAIPHQPTDESVP